MAGRYNREATAPTRNGVRSGASKRYPYDGFGRGVGPDFVHFGDSSVASSKSMRCTVVMQSCQTASKEPVAPTDFGNFSKPHSVDRNDFLNTTELKPNAVRGARCGIGDDAVARLTNRPQAVG